MATKGDFFYFDSFRSMADLSSVESVYISVNYCARDSKGKLVLGSSEHVGYDYWTEETKVDDVGANAKDAPETSVIEYDKEFPWKNYLNHWGLTNTIFSILIVDKDGSWIRFGVTFDSKLFSYAK